ncbi:MAG: hypothetical protein AAF664_21080 [Planctomycetota bacterium]
MFARLQFYSLCAATLFIGASVFADTFSVTGNATIKQEDRVDSFSISDSGMITRNGLATIIDDEALCVETDGLIFAENVLFVDMSATYIGNKFAYRLGLEHDSFSNDSTATFDLDFRLSEDWSLNPRRLNAVLPDLELVGRYVWSARVTHELADYADTNGSSIGDPYSVSVFTGIDTQSLSLGPTVFSDGFSKDIEQTIGVRYGVAGQNAGTIKVELNTNFNLAPDSIFNVFSEDSFDLVRVEFEDGSTPEDHGFDFVRASGRLSPNISAIPEPTLAVVPGLLLGLVLRRRSRQ